MLQDRNEREEVFTEAYKGLNEDQRRAVDAIDGPVMVIAGPGTGKTQVLTLRIAQIIKSTDTAPESILALTFTESGARAMRERLFQYVGTVAYRVPIYTFHGFCGSVIGEYPDAYPQIIGGTNATMLDKINIIETILEERTGRTLRPLGNPSYYVPHIITQLSILKQEYVTPTCFAEIIAAQEATLADTLQFHERGAHKGKVRGEYAKLSATVEKNRELLAVYQKYEALLRDRKRYDFDDMIIMTIDALTQNENMLRDLQERYQYVLADEHQDVNGAQNRILELLTTYHSSPNIFVVGDEKQAIYRFQGASLENFLYFDTAFGKTKTVSLTENYRSGQTILDAAHSLISVSEGELATLRVPLTAASVSDSHITLSTYSHEAVERDDLIARIRKEVTAGTLPSEIAVILRTNREVEEYAAAIRAAGVPVAASADGDILTHPITIQIVELMTAVTEPENEAALLRVLHGAYWGISAADVVHICAARAQNMPLSKLISHEETLQELGLDNPASVREVYRVLTAARRRSATDSPQRVLAFMLEESGFLTLVNTDDPRESARVVRRLYDEIEALVRDGSANTLNDVRAALRTYQEHSIGLTAPYITTTSNAVSVMTAHKAKGLEFEVVFIPHLTDRNWGQRTRRKYFTIPLTRHEYDEYDTFDDERRLFYVALTRAKRTLMLSYAKTDVADRALTASRLLAEVDEACITPLDTTAAEETFQPTSAISPQTPLAIDTDLIRSVLSTRGFSATSLNNYMKSPYEYLYRNVLQVPEVQPTHMLYGTALHGVLEAVVRGFRTSGTVPTATELSELLTIELAVLPLSAHERTQLHEKGCTALSVYVPHLTRTCTENTETEKNIRVLMETGYDEVPFLPLSGKLDRVDCDASGRAIRVVDYKTGLAKTRNAIYGKTKTSDGSYYRQLVFYALLLSLYDDERYATRECTLSFVEPDTKGQVREETFTIDNKEIEALKMDIMSAVRVLISGEAFQEPCNPEFSSYCHLVDALRALR